MSDQMVSILIGHNNLCDFCVDPVENGPETFGRLLEESIDPLCAQVPRLFVNLLSPIDVSILSTFSSCANHPPSPMRTRPNNAHRVRCVRRVRAACQMGSAGSGIRICAPARWRVPMR